MKKVAVKQVKESYSMADLNKMNDQELVETLGSIMASNYRLIPV